MTNGWDELLAAAQENDRKRALGWVFEEFWWGEKATLQVGSCRVVVVDLDGDCSEWSLLCHRVCIAFGSSIGNGPVYHYDEAIDAAWVALREVLGAGL
jgi:hypothetical protein